jgi:4-amino-4-deoxychorismate lyase
MFPFFETIALDQGCFRNLAYHEARVEATQKHFYGRRLLPSLDQLLSIPPSYDGGLWRCRLEYGRSPGIPVYTPYQSRTIRTLYLADASEIDYAFKFQDRTAIEKLRDLCLWDVEDAEDTADILMVRNGCLTDTSFANVLLLHEDGCVYTPDTPMLPGTMRAFLLRSGLIRERPLLVADALSARGIMLINAMLPWDPTRWVRNVHTF